MNRHKLQISGVALVLGAFGFLGQAHAQQTGAPGPQDKKDDVVRTNQATSAQQTATPAPPERVVVLGSLIATAPEDAPKPTQVFTLDEIAEQGATTAADSGARPRIMA